jgi:phosphopantothenoylcysteine synthetase/decarboxylase
MSRSYRIAVKESINRVIRAEDRVSTQLEILEVLPPEQMGALLAEELEKKGFEKQGEVMVRKNKGVTITVNPETGQVTVTAEASEKMEAEVEKEGRAYDDAGVGAKAVREQLKKQAKDDLEKKAEEKKAGLQTKVTDRLEGELRDIRGELDQVVNKVTAEALKRKAATMGQIKEMTEDETGNLTIVVEV